MSSTVHYLAEMGDQVAVCASEEDYQSWDPDDVTCPDCIDFLNGNVGDQDGTPEDDYSEEAVP